MVSLEPRLLTAFHKGSSACACSAVTARSLPSRLSVPAASFIALDWPDACPLPLPGMGVVFTAGSCAAWQAASPITSKALKPNTITRFISF